MTRIRTEGLDELLQACGQRAASLLASVSRNLPPVRGRGALAYRLFGVLGPMSAGREWRIPMARGYRMRAPRSSAMSWSPAFTGRYDDVEISLLSEFFEAGTTALDVGANFGFYTIPLALKAQREGSAVLAFEPVPGNLAILRANITANHLDGVAYAVPVGLGDERLDVEFQVERGGLGDAHVRLERLAVPRQSVDSSTSKLRMERLDEVALPAGPSGRRCSVMKMDIQGFEAKALAGAEEFIAKHRPVIFGEFCPWHMEQLNIQADAPERWADAHGYRAWEVSYRRPVRWMEVLEHSFLPIARGGRRATRDSLLFIPDERGLPTIVERFERRVAS